MNNVRLIFIPAFDAVWWSI